MPGKIEFKIEGALEMERLLKELGPQVAARAGDKALRAAGKVIVDRAKELVPVDTGELRDSITVQAPKRRRRQGERQMLVGFERPTSAIAHLVEFGTAPHGGHPGTAPHPFMTPALDEKAGEALDKMGKALGEGITRAAERLAGWRGKGR